MALRGRVLGDEEAVKYWNDRGAAPGGSNAGSYKDDPATRAIQRRGAPGRKPWVKPPPKPPVKKEQTKDLEAKRTFLALKVRRGAGNDRREKSVYLCSFDLECSGMTNSEHMSIFSSSLCLFLEGSEGLSGISRLSRCSGGG